MSLDIKGRTCVVCHSRFFEEDDVVFCPTCGAPHHRSCYNSVGKCGLEELHGTDEQYDFKKIPIGEKKAEEAQQDAECAFCHAKFENNAKVCPYCGRPRVNAGFVVADFLGGVDAQQDIGGGVTADEAKNLVVLNTHRYIPKFASGRRVSWNWMAFLFPQAWYLSRKMYKLGALILAILVAATIFTLPAMEFINSQLPKTYTQQELMQYLYQILPEMNAVPLLLMAASSVINVLVRLISGLFGDYWYKNYVITKVIERKDSELEKDEYNQKYGGVNLFMAVIGFMIVSYLPSLLSMLL